MADFVFNIALGRIRTYAELSGGANDALLVVPIEATGIEADETLRDHDDLEALLAGTSNEQTTAGRKTISASITVTVDDANNRLDIDVPDQVWAGLTGNGIGALVFAYDGDTTAGDDGDVVPMSKHDFAITPDGSDVTAVIAAAGLLRAAG